MPKVTDPEMQMRYRECRKELFEFLNKLDEEYGELHVKRAVAEKFDYADLEDAYDAWERENGADDGDD